MRGTELGQLGQAGVETRPAKRGEVGIVGGPKLGLWRKYCPIDLCLCYCEGLLVEAGEASGEGQNEVVEFGVGDGSGGPSVTLGGLGIIVVTAEDGFQCPVTAREPWEAFGGAAAGNPAERLTGVA